MTRRIMFLIAIAGVILTSAAFAEDETLYVYSITDIEGSITIETMDASDVAKAKDDQNTAEKNAKKDYLKQQKEWAEVFDKAPFPLSPPKSPKLDQLQRAPKDQDALVKAIEKARDKLEVYNIIMLSNAKGELSGEMVRRDKVYGTQRKIEKEFVEAALAYKLLLKKDPPAAQKQDPPKKPFIKLVRENVRGQEAAEKFLEDFNKELEQFKQKQAEKEAAKEAKEAAKEEKERQREPANPEPDKANALD